MINGFFAGDDGGDDGDGEEEKEEEEEKEGQYSTYGKLEEYEKC